MKKQTNFIMDTVFLPESSAMRSGYIIDSVSVFASAGISCGLPTIGCQEIDRSKRGSRWRVPAEQERAYERASILPTLVNLTAPRFYPFTTPLTNVSNKTLILSQLANLQYHEDWEWIKILKIYWCRVKSSPVENPYIKIHFDNSIS